MKLYHKEPCAECPWRKTSAQGYLGGYPPEMYADAVACNEVPACHLKDNGPESDDTAMCAGALSVMANACISAWKTPGGDEARKEVGRRDDTFRHPRMFYEYHANKPYVHPLLRVRVRGVTVRGKGYSDGYLVTAPQTPKPESTSEKMIRGLIKIARGNNCKNPMSGGAAQRLAKETLNSIGVDWCGSEAEKYK